MYACFAIIALFLCQMCYYLTTADQCDVIREFRAVRVAFYNYYYYYLKFTFSFIELLRTLEILS